MLTLHKFSTPVATIGLLAVVLGSAQAQTWQRVTPAGAGFSVQMPGAPEPSTQNVTTAIGPVAMHSYTISSGSEGYFVAYSDFPMHAEAQLALDGARNSAFANGRVFSESNITLSGYPGRIVYGTMGAYTVTLRMYVVNNRFFQVMYLSKGSSLPQSALAFFDSFRILR